MNSAPGPSRWLLLACVFFAHSAPAFFEEPYITPANPHTGEQLTVNIDQGVCDSVVGEPGYPQVTQDGSSVHVLLFALRYDNPIFCIFPPNTATIAFGSLPVGSYSVTIDAFYYGLHGTPQTITLGVVPVVVSGVGSSAIPAPATDGPSLLILVALLAVVARRRMLAALCWQSAPRQSA